MNPTDICIDFKMKFVHTAALFGELPVTPLATTPLCQIVEEWSVISVKEKHDVKTNKGIKAPVGLVQMKRFCDISAEKECTVETRVRANNILSAITSASETNAVWLKKHTQGSQASNTLAIFFHSVAGVSFFFFCFCFW